jgi:2-polyprenyl-6-methoxyphenol hydroxylase-like FAD-dependent oxidoreductase
VVGGGIAGLAFAAASRDQWRVELLERATRPRGGRAGIVLHPNAVRALRRIIDVEEIVERSAVIERMVLHEGDGQIVVPLADVWGNTETHTLGVSRATLHEILLREAMDAGDVLADVEVVGIQSQRSVARLSLANGSEIEAGLVVAADGVHSTVRRVLNGMPATKTGFQYARWVVSSWVLPRGEWHVWRNGSTSIGGYPLGAGHTHVFLQRPCSDPPGDDATEVLAGHRPFGRDVVAHGGILVHEDPAFHLPRHLWRAQRTVFIGDAAHALTPTMSEGGGLAIEDGVALAHALRTHGVSDAALAKFEDARAPRVAWAAKMGGFQLRTAHRGAQTSGGIQLAKLMRAMYRPLAASAPMVDAPEPAGPGGALEAVA